ncbi:hypothetical protein CRG98_033469 [Punica granatum]|uniref:TIR domain-containing protein n=1 Tax=Punica granatum TaxID=22663 RepID=A0A2I0IRS1_PUNGR|nr:hypothetical protein CRG98_033469 [Punica granatum]
MAAATKLETWDDYQVFLSFRGPDTRQSFTDCLYNFMIDAGIRVFRDDDELSIGQPIDTILSAIENSNICMPVFSPTFASSAWCLREVAKMVELKKEVVPIFFGVTPDDVKLRTSVYGNFMGKHELKYGKDQVKQWEDALKEVAKIKGRELKEKGYYGFSKELTREVLIKLRPNKKHVPSNLIGMDDQVETVLKLLDTKSSGIRRVGIYGMGGIGKTTLAEILFNKLSVTFDCCGFLPDVRESLRRTGLEHLQKALLCKLEPRLKDTDHIVDPVKMIRETFRRRKIDGLVGEADHFGSGSRIIVTTRDVRVLKIGVEEFYEMFEVKEMTFSQGLQLFSRHAFRRDSPTQDFMSLSQQVVSSCQGLPLSLKVFGSLLLGKDEIMWIATIRKLEKVPDQEVLNKLKISYEALEHEQQQIFLDIACFFINTQKSHVSYMWDACGFHPATGLDVLVSMSLIKGKEAIVGLHLERLHPDSIEEVLAGLHNVRYLSLEAAELSNRFKHPLPELKWLSLPRCPASFNPHQINIRKLVILELPHSSISEKWNGWRYIQLSRLESLNLACGSLGSRENSQRHPFENANALPTSFVDLSQLEILEVCCEHLKCIPMLPSSLRRLVLYEFNLGVILPDISYNKNLEYLCLIFSEEVLKYHNFPQLPVSLRELRIFCPATLPDLTNLKNLRKFVLAGGASLKEIQGIRKLESLEELDICECESLESLENLSELRNLKCLSILGCPKLRFIEGLERLPLVQKDVHLGDCKCVECLPAQSTSRPECLPAQSTSQPECLPAESTSRPSRRRQLVSLVVSKLWIPHSDLPWWIQQYLERGN